MGSPDAAAEIAQNVFVGLARGAHSLWPRLETGASLAGWLCRSARNLSLNFRRDEFRRQSRERQLMQQLITTPDATPDWERLRPVLDHAISAAALAGTAVSASTLLATTKIVWHPNARRHPGRLPRLEQLAAYPDYQQAEARVAAENSAGSELATMTGKMELSPDQQDKIRSALYQYNLAPPPASQAQDAFARAKAGGDFAEAIKLEADLKKQELEDKLIIFDGILTP